MLSASLPSDIPSCLAASNCNARNKLLISSSSPGIFRCSRATNSLLARSRVMREASASSELPLSKWISSVAVGMATFITTSLIFVFGLASIASSSALCSGGSKMCSKVGLVRRETNHPRAPAVCESRAFSTATASWGIGAPVAHDSLSRAASSAPMDCASPKEARCAAPSDDSRCSPTRGCGVSANAMNIAPPRGRRQGSRGRSLRTRLCRAAWCTTPG
mmetsp:Transcript_20804/g.51965  ORF Transcript_20804/g.51965 Transcript_20804/m.51965 type:complete len:219 (-) Transcript_20804:94-750(-)